jgi:hypothetical protein
VADEWMSGSTRAAAGRRLGRLQLGRVRLGRDRRAAVVARPTHVARRTVHGARYRALSVK